MTSRPPHEPVPHTQSGRTPHLARHSMRV